MTPVLRTFTRASPDHVGGIRIVSHRRPPGLGARVIVTGSSDSGGHPGGFAPHNRVGGPE